MNGTILMAGMTLLEEKFEKYSNSDLTDIKVALEKLNLTFEEMNKLCKEIRDANFRAPRPAEIVTYIKEKLGALPGLDK